MKAKNAGKGSDKIIVFFMAVKSDCYGNVNVDVRVRGTLKRSQIKFRSIFGDCWKLFNFKSFGGLNPIIKCMVE